LPSKQGKKRFDSEFASEFTSTFYTFKDRFIFNFTIITKVIIYELSASFFMYCTMYNWLMDLACNCFLLSFL